MLAAALGASTVDGNTVRTERFTLYAPVWLRAWLAWLGADGGRERARTTGRRFDVPVRRASAWIRLRFRPGGRPRRSAGPGRPGQPAPPRQSRWYRQAEDDVATRPRKRRHRRGSPFRQRRSVKRQRPFRHCDGPFRQRQPFWCRWPLRPWCGSFRCHYGSFWYCCGSLRCCAGSFRCRCGSLRSWRGSFRCCYGSFRCHYGSFWYCCGSFRCCAESFRCCYGSFRCCGRPFRPHR